MSLFNEKRDRELITVGTHFWCKTHLSACPIDDISPDPLYRRACYEVLKYEAELLTEKNYTRRPWWWPVDMLLGDENNAEKQKAVPTDVSINMHTENATKNEVCIINSQPPIGKRGPKHKELPEDLISQWAGDGMGSKAIATRLKNEMGIIIHYSTIQRRLKNAKQATAVAGGIC